MICPSCHTANRDDAKFCKKCRYEFSSQSEVAKVPEAVMAQQNSASTPATEGSDASEDISLAPTQIISPEKMMALHASRWQQELAQEQQGPSASMAEASSPAESAELPTPTPDAVPMPPLQNSAAPTGANQEEQPAPSTNDAAIPIPPPPPPHPDPDEALPPTPSAEASNPYLAETIYPPLAETVYAAAPTNSATDEGSRAREQNPMQDNPASTPASTKESAENTAQDEGEGATILPTHPTEATPAPNNFPVLAVGVMVVGRYGITQIVSEEAQEHVYDVVDLQGYQRCWNCGSDQNSEGDEFCINCGAGLLNATYIMHEYPASSAQQDSSVLHGLIVNTFVDQDHTYVIVQVQAVEEAFPNGVHLIAASDSDAGNVRRSDPNEDSTLVLMLQRVHESQSSPSGVFIIADGMGGHDNGQGASLLAISTIAERMVRELLTAPLLAEQKGEAAKPLDEDALVSLLQGTVEDANAAICKVNQRDKTDMGSTITGFMVYKDYAYILNVGDSRTYMVRGGQIYQLTTDHSLVGQLVAGGLIQPEDVYTHPQRSQIFRSLGDKLNVQIDIFKQQLHPGDILLSCSDGLWEMVRNPELEGILNKAPDPQAACSQLIEAANANGGEDNVSAVVVFVH